MARETARQQRLAEVEQRRRVRAQIQAKRTAERQQAQESKEAKQRYLESRIAEAEDATQELADRVEELVGILNHALSEKHILEFETLKAKDEYPAFESRANLVAPAAFPIKDAFVPSMKSPGVFGKLLPFLQARYQQAVDKSESDYHAALASFQVQEAERQRELEAAYLEYERDKAKHLAEVATQNQEIEEFRASYLAGDPRAIVDYCGMVLERSDYPEGFPQGFHMGYVPESKQLIVEYELPSLEVIPGVVEYRYIRTRDEIQPKPRKQTEIRELYQDVVAATTLRIIHEVFEADQGGHLDVVAVNGFVQAVDLATGKVTRRYLASLRVPRERFSEINLFRVNKTVCLQNLGAQISKKLHEFQPIRPLVDLNMVAQCFIEQDSIDTPPIQPANHMAKGVYIGQQLKGRKEGLEGISGKSLRIATEKPAGWQGKLFAQLVNDEVVNACELKRTYELRLAPGASEHLADNAILDWLMAKLSEAERLAEGITRLANRALNQAFANSDIQQIAHCAREMGRSYRKAIEWAISVRGVQVGDNWVQLVSEASLATGDIIRQIELLGPHLTTAIDDAIASANNGQIIVDFTFAIRAENAHRIYEEMERIKVHLL